MGGECGLVFVEVEDFSAIVEKFQRQIQSQAARRPEKLIVSLCQQLNKLTRIMPGNIVIDLQFGFEHFQEELGEQSLQESEHPVSLVGPVSWLPCRLHFSSWCLSQESPTHPVGCYRVRRVPNQVPLHSCSWYWQKGGRLHDSIRPIDHVPQHINKDKPAEEYKLAVPAIGRNNGAALYRRIQTVYK